MILTDTDISNKWFVIVNPNAGRKKGKKDWTEIKSLLSKSGLTFESSFTKHKGHALEISMKAIKRGFRKFIVVGGDGTLNETINSILDQELVASTDFIIGMIPVGTGNDWGRMYNIPKNYEEAINTIKANKQFIQDAGKVIYNHKNKIHSRYFVNVAGMGYDALVAQKTNMLKEKGGGGTLSYLINLLLGLIQYKFNEFTLTIDNKVVFKGKAFSLSIGICKYNGGGMMQLPYAVPDNGLFDITLIKKASKFKVIRNLKNLYDGSFVKIKEVETFKGKNIQILSKPPRSVYLEADGESLGHSPLEFSLINKSIKLISAQDF